MILFRIITLLFFAQLAFGQVYCTRIIGHTPHYERIFLSKSDFLRGPSLRGVDDIAPADLYRGTNRIDRIFADSSGERTNRFFQSCLSEVPVAELSLRCPAGLLTSEEVGELLRNTVAVPRSYWTNHMAPFGGWRYVFSLAGSKSGEYVVDERPGACAIVFFPDGTYRCIMSPSWECVGALQRAGPAYGSLPVAH